MTQEHWAVYWSPLHHADLSCSALRVNTNTGLTWFTGPCHTSVHLSQTLVSLSILQTFANRPRQPFCLRAALGCRETSDEAFSSLKCSSSAEVMKSCCVCTAEQKNSRFSHEGHHVTRILQSGTPLMASLRICGKNTFHLPLQMSRQHHSRPGS